MWRVPSERIKLDLDGPTVEVESIHSDLIQFEGLQLFGAFVAATTPEANYRALATLYDYFVAESRPTWDYVDHLGPVPNTARGMMRLGTEISTGIVAGWLRTLPSAGEAEEPQSAVDAVIPAGPLNRELKRRLATAKRRNKAA